MDMLLPQCSSKDGWTEKSHAAEAAEERVNMYVLGLETRCSDGAPDIAERCHVDMHHTAEAEPEDMPEYQIVEGAVEPERNNSPEN